MSAHPQPGPPAATTRLQLVGPDLPVTAAWPQTKLVSGLLTLGLGFVLALPGLVGRGELAVLALLAGVLGAAAGRLTFHSRSVSTAGRVGLRGVLGSLPPSAVALAISLGAVRAGGIVPPAWSLAVAGLATPAAFVLAAELRALEVRYLRSARRVFLIGSEDQYDDVAREVRRQTDVSLVGFAGVSGPDARVGAAEEIDALAARVAEAGATMLVLSSEATRSDAFCAVAARVRLLGCRVRDLTSFYERHFRKEPLSELTPSWFLFDVAEIHRPRLYGMCKRTSECLLAAAGLIVLAPVLVAVAGAVKLSSRGPVLFRQLRVGRGDEPFTLLKFRTMLCAPGAGAAWAGDEQARITRVGRILRRTRVDELPQLWNVVRGQLSLVGPRPEQVDLVRWLEADIEYYRARHCVRPGMTGWAQINYGYGGSRDGTLEKLQYDFYYVKRQSLRLDLLILASTARAVFAGSGF